MKNEYRDQNTDFGEPVAVSVEWHMFFFIPFDVTRNTVARSFGRGNLIKECSLLTKKSYEELHRICNERTTGNPIQLRKTTSFFT